MMLSAARHKDTLFVTLALVTVVPTLLPIVAVSMTGFQPTWTQFVFFIGILGNAHVGMTAFFYIGDRRYKPVISQNIVRYVVLPISCVLFAFALFTWSTKGFWLYFAIHYAWLLWHFGRQNFGLYAFVAAGNRSGPISQLERYFFSLLPVAAIPKAWTLYSDVGVGTALQPWLEGVSIFLALVAGVLLVGILARSNVRRDGQRSVALLLATAFFLPTLISSNPAVALSFFAHPLQYIVMMLYLAGDRKQGWMLIRFCVLIVCGLSLWAAMSATQGVMTNVFLALSYGISQAHFLVDAGAWKLKLPAQRAIIAASYDFLFKPHPSAARPAPAVEGRELGPTWRTAPPAAQRP